MKKSDCVQAATCQGNCGICSIYKSTKDKNDDRLIMVLVKWWKEAETSFAVEQDRLNIQQIAQKLLTEAEYRIFQFEISQNSGI
jgi:hypothetical protein